MLDTYFSHPPIPVFRPVSASAKLYINPYAETELTTPKIDLNMEVQSIAVELTKPQVRRRVTYGSHFGLVA